jgi:hypothetical protein
MGCTNQVVQGGVCRRHGAKTKQKLCIFEGGCTNLAVREGVCKRHGANKKRKASNTNDAGIEETEEESLHRLNLNILN